MMVGCDAQLVCRLLEPRTGLARRFELRVRVVAVCAAGVQDIEPVTCDSPFAARIQAILAQIDEGGLLDRNAIARLESGPGRACKSWIADERRADRAAACVAGGVPQSTVQLAGICMRVAQCPRLCKRSNRDVVGGAIERICMQGQCACRSIDAQGCRTFGGRGVAAQLECTGE